VFRGRNRRRGTRLELEARLIEDLLTWLAGLPPQGIYGAIALLAALENIFPPVPADTAVALGAFLAARGAPISVWGVYLVTLVSNVTSAAGMFLVARTAGRAFFESPAGQRILSRRSLALLEREYQRHHLWGIFLSRFVPGYRAVVPPFAAIAGLPASRALPPVALATAIYYAALVFLAHRVGQSWDAVRRLVGQLSAGLAAAAVAATLLIAALVWRRRRARAASHE
jgi:membrane protein DedA with SNARE-associated domain